MPGLVGLVTQMPRERAEADLGRMLESIRHDPCYRTGTWIDESAGVYVGWALREKSLADALPIRNEKGDVVLIFSGEEFPEPDTICQLKRRGHRFRDGGPSYLVHAFEEDPSFPAGLNGRFHGIVTDRQRGVATLFNDRYGMHRVYCHESPDAFYFAVEAKAILAVRPELRRTDPRALGELVACGCVLENRTLFDGVRVMPSSSAWVFRHGALEKKNSYFDSREWEQQTLLEPEAYYEELRDVFSKKLPRYFGGPEPVGMSLTGGLDSRMVMAWHKAASGSLACYSFRGTFRDCQDTILARQVASLCNQPHEVISVGPEFLSRFSRYAERTVHLSDGCAEVVRSADLYVNERAREIAPVRMTGNYGGEVLRRVRAFKPVDPSPGLFRPEFLSHVGEAKRTYAGLLQGHPLSFAVFQQAPWFNYGLGALEQTQLSMRSPYLDNDFVRTVFRAPPIAHASNDVCLRLIADGDAALGQIRTDRGVGGSAGRLAAAASRAVLEFQFKAEYAYDYGMPQWVAWVDGRLSHLRLERAFLGRHKFYHFRLWYRDALAGYVREMLLDPRTLSRPYLEPNRVRALVESHIGGTRNYTTEIHKVLTLELVHRLFIDQK
jgi:asparagine synthase (glutamine-hydrolysing)